MKGLSAFCKRKSLELIRRQSCDQHTITQFFTENMDLLSRDPEPTLSADATHMASKNTFQALANPGRLWVGSAREKEQLFTARCCFTGTGFSLPVTFVLPDTIHLPSELLQFTSNPLFWHRK
jgi:hypothetical protein